MSSFIKYLQIHSQLNDGIRLLVIILISVFLGLTVSYLLTLKAFNKTEIYPVDYNTLSCKTSSKSNATFRIYTLSWFTANKLLKEYCADPILSKEYLNITIQWQHENIHNLKLLQDSYYQLLIANPYTLDSPFLNGLTEYNAIGYYPPYSSYLISLSEIPSPISDQYLIGKRIGLLQSRNSRSGFLEPKKLFKKHNVLKFIKIKYYKSHQDLRRALKDHEVDIIGSYWSKEDQIKYSGAFTFKTVDTLKAYNWYMSKKNALVTCQVIKGLDQLAKDSNSPYYSNLKFKVGC